MAIANYNVAPNVTADDATNVVPTRAIIKAHKVTDDREKNHPHPL